MAVVLALIAAMTVLNTAMLALLFFERLRVLLGRAKEARVEQEVEAAQRRADYMDEGFENIMRYSVMGRDGFERGES